MWKQIRSAHLLLGLIATPFVLIYAVSALFMAHHVLNFASPSVEITTFEFAAKDASRTPMQWREWLRAAQSIDGHFEEVSTDGERIELSVERPAEQNQIVIDRSRLTGRITTRRSDLQGFLIALHTTAGAWSGPLASRLWSASVVLLAISLLGVVVTGVPMWLRRNVERRQTLTLFCVSIVCCVVVLGMVRLG